MIVTGIQTKILSVPYKHPDRWSGGENLGLTSILILVSTDEGLTGAGEANGDRSAAAVAAAVHDMEPLVLGHEPFAIEATLADIFTRGKWRNARPFANQAVAGIEMALWDIIGKACGQPVVNLLGGRFRGQVNFYFYLQQDHREKMLQDAVEAVRDGYRVIYLKVGVDDREDVATVAALREAVGPGIKIRVDANEAWSPGHAIAMIHRLSPYHMDFVEQPVGSRDLDGLVRVRAASPVAIAANQTAFTHFDVLEVIKRNAADVIVTGPHQCGGLLQFKKVAAMAETAGLPINRHSVGELGVGALAGLHVAASVPNLTDGNQTHHQLLADDIVAEPLRFVNGCLTVPTSPGLGVLLDDAKVQKYSRLYEKRGQYFNFPISLQINRPEANPGQRARRRRE